MQPNSFRLTEGSSSRARSGGTDPERSCPGGPEPSAPVAAGHQLRQSGGPGTGPPPGSPRLRLPTGLRWFLGVTLLVHPSSTLPCLGAHTVGRRLGGFCPQPPGHSWWSPSLASEGVHWRWFSGGTAWGRPDGRTQQPPGVGGKRKDTAHSPHDLGVRSRTWD